MDKGRFVHFGAEMAEKCQLKIEMYKTWKMGRTFRGRSGIYLAESGARAIHEVRALCYHGSGTFEKGSARVYGNLHRPLPVAEGLLREGARLFEFESDARAGTKANAHDARMKMLELFGASAVSWTIEKVERAGAAPAEKREKTTDGQLALDFRPPKPERKRKHSKGYW